MITLNIYDHPLPQQWHLMRNTYQQLSCEILERVLILSSHVQQFAIVKFTGSMTKFLTQHSRSSLEISDE